MLRKLCSLPWAHWALGLVVAALVAQSAVGTLAAAAAEKLPPATQWIPQDAILVLEISQPKALLDSVLDPKTTKAVTALPEYQRLASQQSFGEFMGVLGYLEAMVGAQWKTVLRKVVGGGVTLAADAQGTVRLIVDAEDPQMLEKLHEVLLAIARGEAEKQGQPGRVASAEYRGVTGWTFGGGDEAHAIVGKRLLLSNKPQGLKDMLDLRANAGGKSLASVPAYQAAQRAAVSRGHTGSDTCATAFVNVGVLKQVPPLKEALGQSSNPLAALLFTGITESLRQSNWLALGLQVEGKTLTLHAAVDGKAIDPTGPSAFALPREVGKGSLPNLWVPRRIAGLSFYRDLHAFYAAKNELFPERTSELIFFENMMGIFFSGLDLTDEVLGQTEPEVRFVVAQQEYDPAVGTPGLQIPAFAAIFRLRDPDHFVEVVEEAWQKVIGLTNFTRGQQAEPGLIIDKPTHADTKFSVAYFRPPEEAGGKQIDARFNYRPSLASVGDYIILSSTDGLARDLIDALKKEIAAAVKPLVSVPTADCAHSLVEVNAEQLASILNANRDSLVRQNMVNEGSTKEQAETQMDLLITVVKHLGQAKLIMTNHQGRPQATLELKLNLP